jgi:hypothetical protein
VGGGGCHRLACGPDVNARTLRYPRIGCPRGRSHATRRFAWCINRATRCFLRVSRHTCTLYSPISMRFDEFTSRTHTPGDLVLGLGRRSAQEPDANATRHQILGNHRLAQFLSQREGCQSRIVIHPVLESAPDYGDSECRGAASDAYGNTSRG